jgi:transglutaminase-like putative cysteine protease
MRLRISHLTTYRYATPATSVIQTLRVTPRNHDGQFITNWRIDVSSDCRLDQHKDAFGNITHTFTADGPLDELKVLVEGEVETRDTSGVVIGAVERFPPSLYLRETELTRPDEAVAQLAGTARSEAGADDLKLLHLLLERMHLKTPHDGAQASQAQASQAQASQAQASQAQASQVQASTAAAGPSHAAYQDFAHAFIAAARSVGIPARCVSGYFRRGNGAADEDAGHAWAEAFVGGLGWIAFDVANGICATDAHIRVAIGLDYLGAAPVRGMHYGGAAETLSVIVRVQQAASQVQG